MSIAMTVAGSDPSGGAGVLADVKAMASLGVHAVTAITALTAQNTKRVSSVHPVPPEFIASQIKVLREDVDIRAVKTGMLYSAAAAEAVASQLSGSEIPLVVDPVLEAGNGGVLASDDLMGALKAWLIPMSTLVTPNLPEAEAIVGRSLRSDADVIEACREMVRMGAQSVLVKGGHRKGEDVTDMLYCRGKVITTSVPRLSVRGHGGGCVLSAYITAELAKGRSVYEAVIRAEAYESEAVKDNYAIGKGSTVVDPFGAVLRDAIRYRSEQRLKHAAEAMRGGIGSSVITGGDVLYAVPDLSRSACQLHIIRGPVGLNPMAEDVTPATERALRAAMSVTPMVRSAVALEPTDTTVAMLQTAGLTVGKADVVDADAQDHPDHVTIPEFIARSDRHMPDAMLVSLGRQVRPSYLFLFARSPEDLLAKLGRRQA